MDAFARERPEIRAEAFRETAVRMDILPVIIEKDFWVCWALKRIFSLDNSIPGVLLKGGTSLSKAYGAIRRFSEDIDLSLDRHDLGFTGDHDPAADISNTARRALLEKLKETAIETIVGPVRDALVNSAHTALDADVEITVDESDPQTLLFAYPQSLGVDKQSAYVRPTVRLEFGARSDQLPSEQKEIAPYIHSEFPDLIGVPMVSVKTLAAERTFWEKATILHMLYHRDPKKRLGERMSRHYYDLVQLARSSVKKKALDNLELLAAVAEHKAVFYRYTWANYDEARPPTLRLSPGSELEQALKTDYLRMREMLFDEPESFEDLLNAVAGLEAEINTLRDTRTYTPAFRLPL